jgi:hypothetical protein
MTKIAKFLVFINLLLFMVIIYYLGISFNNSSIPKVIQLIRNKQNKEMTIKNYNIKKHLELVESIRNDHGKYLIGEISIFYEDGDYICKVLKNRRRI